MTRRDTIIIAVLVNAGLLMVLFATAMRSEKKADKAGKVEMEIAKVDLKKSSKASQITDLLNEPLKSPTQSEEIIFSDSFDEEELVLAFTENTKIEPTPIQEEPKAIDHKISSVTVKKGDVLEKIARAHGTTVAALMEMNHLSSTQLKIGQLLKVPGSSQNSSSSSATASPILNGAEEYYIVKEGDNPWMIATKNKVKWEDLLHLNNLDAEKARRLRPGDKLRLR